MAPYANLMSTWILFFIFKGVSSDIQSAISVTCNFEDNGPCGWKNIYSNSDVWRYGAGSTPSHQTGPSHDHTLGTASGMYLFTESTGASHGRIARLISHLVASGTYCFQFWYHMYGDTMGTFRVEAGHLSTSGDNTLIVTSLLFEVSGDHGDRWLKGEATVNETTPFMLVLESEVGSGHASDIAVDDLLLEVGQCWSPPVVG